MAETIVWCNMIYNISFYISLIIYIYNSIAGNLDMKNNAFQAVVILGLFNILNRR